MSKWDIASIRLLHYLLESGLVFLVILFVHQIKFVLAIPVALFLLWRMIEHFREIDHENEILLLSISLLVGLVVYSLYETITVGKYIIMTILYQLILVILIGVNRVYIKMKNQGDLGTKMFTGWAFGLTGVLFGIGLVFLLFFPYIQVCVLQLINLLLRLLNPDSPESLPPESLYAKNTLLDQMPPPDEVYMNPIVFYFIIGLIVFLLVSIVIYIIRHISIKPFLKPEKVRKHKAKILIEDNIKSQVEKQKKYPVPTNKIRKRFYQFEIQMLKYGFGRRINEPVLMWFERVDINNANLAIDLYEKVRYGELNLDEAEQMQYFNLMDELTYIAKENKKNRKNRK